MNIKLLTEQQLEFLSLKGGCTASSEMPNCWKSHVADQMLPGLKVVPGLQMGIIFLILNQNLWCGYLKAPKTRKLVLKLMDKNIIAILRAKTLLILISAALYPTQLNSKCARLIDQVNDPWLSWLLVLSSISPSQLIRFEFNLKSFISFYD